MPEQQAPPDSGPGAQADAGPGKPSNLARLKILAFVLLVIAAECAVAYVYLPSGAGTPAMAHATAEAVPPIEEASPEGGEPQEAEADQIEVDLGEFSVTAFQPASNATLRIDFHLYGTIDAKEQEEFTRLKEENLHRFREQVLVTVRSADMTDLSDAGLGLIKRKLLEKSNQVFGKPTLRGVVFSDFSFFEQ